MRDRFSDDDEAGYGTAFRDIIFTLFAVIAAIVVILLLLPKQPKQADDLARQARGNIRVEIRWPDRQDTDIDIWGQAPNQRPVGYSNKNGQILSLVRDDLGNYSDVTDLNYEVMFSRGLPEGEWAFNIQWFSNPAQVKTVEVEVIITITKDDSTGSKSRPKQIVATTVKLTHVGQEKTIIRFKLDKNGDMIPDSMTTLFKPLRSAPPPDRPHQE